MFQRNTLCIIPSPSFSQKRPLYCSVFFCFKETRFVFFFFLLCFSETRYIFLLLCFKETSFVFFFLLLCFKQRCFVLLFLPLCLKETHFALFFFLLCFSKTRFALFFLVICFKETHFVIFFLLLCFKVTRFVLFFLLLCLKNTPKKKTHTHTHKKTKHFTLFCLVSFKKTRCLLLFQRNTLFIVLSSVLLSTKHALCVHCSVPVSCLFFSSFFSTKPTLYWCVLFVSTKHLPLRNGVSFLFQRSWMLFP